MKIRIFVVDDHPLIIEGLSAIFNNAPDIEYCGYAMDYASCIKYIEENEVDILLVDINLSESSGVALCHEVKTMKPRIKVIALSSYVEGVFVHKMIENGASGYIIKNTAKSEIVNAVFNVYNGNQYISSEVMNAYKIYKSSIEQMTPLTKREKEILLLIAKGLTNVEIGKQLFISIDTVDTHRKNLYSKLGVGNTATLLLKCKELSII